MNIAQKHLKELEAIQAQRSSQMQQGKTAQRDLLIQEYRDAKGKLPTEIKKDIKRISEKYRGFEKFALYAIYKYFDFNRELANEKISLIIQAEEQANQDNENDWTEVKPWARPTPRKARDGIAPNQKDYRSRSLFKERPSKMEPELRNRSPQVDHRPSRYGNSQINSKRRNYFSPPSGKRVIYVAKNPGQQEDKDTPLPKESRHSGEDRNRPVRQQNRRVIYEPKNQNASPPKHQSPQAPSEPQPTKASDEQRGVPAERAERAEQAKKQGEPAQEPRHSDPQGQTPTPAESQQVAPTNRDRPAVSPEPAVLLAKTKEQREPNPSQRTGERNEEKQGNERRDQVEPQRTSKNDYGQNQHATRDRPKRKLHTKRQQEVHYYPKDSLKQGQAHMQKPKQNAQTHLQTQTPHHQGVYNFDQAYPNFPQYPPLHGVLPQAAPFQPPLAEQGGQNPTQQQFNQQFLADQHLKYQQYYLQQLYQQQQYFQQFYLQQQKFHQLCLQSQQQPHQQSQPQQPQNQASAQAVNLEPVQEQQPVGSPFHGIGLPFGMIPGGQFQAPLQPAPVQPQFQGSLGQGPQPGQQTPFGGAVPQAPVAGAVYYYPMQFPVYPGGTPGGNVSSQGLGQPFNGQWNYLGNQGQ